MFRNAIRRLATTLLVLVSLLFSQLALASYICPAGADAQQAAVMDMPGGEPCEGMAADASQPALCHHHCSDPPQSFEPLKLPTVSLPAVVQVLPAPVVMDRAGDRAVAAADVRHPQPAPAPLFLSTLRLRV